MRYIFGKEMSTLLIAIFFLSAITLNAQTTTVGSGSYTNTFPGVDQAGRNGFPPGTPQLSGNAAGKPVPTNDWWSKLVLENHADNLFNYPMTLKTTNQGLIVTYIPWGVIGDSAPIEVGLSGLNTSQTTVSDFSDWTVQMNWKDATHEMKTTAGIGMPFLYFEKESNDEVAIKVNAGTASISNELLIIANASHGADFVFYAPTGSTWSQSGNVYTSTLNGKTYWSMAMLPLNNTSVNSIAQSYKKYAYVFPTNTTANWAYNESTSVLRTDFLIETSRKEGTGTTVLQGLLPHQWNNLAANSATPNEDSYSSVRGEIKMLAGNSFSVENTFKGILPTLPYDVNMHSQGFNASNLATKIAQIENDELAAWTDSYNEGQVMNRLIQTARIAYEMGNNAAGDKMRATIKERLEDWLTYESGEVAFLFYYHNDWSALLGYPAGHGQDSNINDHHFHWGYFIHAAAFMEQYEPGWANSWGPMINLLVRDAASDNRNDTQFPFLRNFSPYAGHCWANGFASFPQGNDQESTSESMQFNSSLIHWGSITGNDAIRDLGIYLYTTEQTAVEEYWLDIHERNFGPNQQYGLVSRVWGNSYDNGTFWTTDIAASYGIEMYPIHGGSMYLGHHPIYVQNLWEEISTNTGILNNEANDNLWHDTYWKYLAFIDPQAAIDLYDSYPNRSLKFGISDAQTYHWLHSMNALGKVNTHITADHPIATSFTGNGFITYVAQNYSNSPITVTFSDGYMLTVPANQLVTNRVVYVDTESPTNFTASIGAVSTNAVEILVDGMDDSGTVIYTVSYGGITTSISSISGVSQTIDITGLTTGTTYTFTVTATDAAGNAAANSPITLTATPTEPTNTDCSGMGTEAQQGSFSIGYNYSFVTNGTDVTFTFELLDTDKSGVVAYLWRENPFGETQMNGSGLTFSTTVSGHTIGETISYACKFAFAGGLAVTRYHSYTVGDNCIEDNGDCIPTGTLCLNTNYAANFNNTQDPILSDFIENCQNTTIQSGATVEVEAKSAVTLNPGFYATSNSVFQAQISNKEYCANMVEESIVHQKTVVPTTIKESSNAPFAFQLFPNPTTNKVTVRSINTSTIQSITVYTILGQQVLFLPQSLPTQSVDLSLSLPAGTYFVKGIDENKQIYIEKLLVNK